jgi:hypothetical protein
MRMATKHDAEKETVLVHDISPELEQELIRRAQMRHRDAGTEASEIIARHVSEEDGFIA